MADAHENGNGKAFVKDSLGVVVIVLAGFAFLLGQIEGAKSYSDKNHEDNGRRIAALDDRVTRGVTEEQQRNNKYGERLSRLEALIEKK